MASDPVQHLKHSCTPEEFRQYRTGVKTFDLKLNDGVFSLQEGDVLTFEERDPETGELTGEKETKRVGIVLNTKSIENISPEDLVQKGLSIFSLVAEDHYTLRAIYDHSFTVSLGLDRTDEIDPQSGNNWIILGEPSYTPALGCPDFIKEGVLNGLNINKWPIGRYSVTLMLQIDFSKKDQAAEVSIVDVIILVIAESQGSSEEFEFVEVHPEILMNGRVIDIRTEREVTPLDIDDVEQLMASYMTKEDLQNYPNLISNDEMKKLLEDAKARGEDTSILEQAFLNEDDDEDGDEDDDEDIEDLYYD